MVAAECVFVSCVFVSCVLIVCFTIQLTKLLEAEESTRVSLDAFLDWSKVKVAKSTILYDAMPDTLPGAQVEKFRMQAPHIDFRLTADPNCQLWVSITAVHSPMRLIIWPRSHAMMMDLATYHGWPDFMKNSSKLVDRDFCDQFTTKPFMPKVIQLQPGETILFHGMLVHAGAPGQLDAEGNVVPAYRLHRYIMPIASDIDVAYGANGRAYTPTFPVVNPALGMEIDIFGTMFYDRSQDD